MFQSFDVTSTPQFGRERTDALRATFDGLGIDGFLVPRADEFQGEYVPKSAERLAWLTGFTGSAGIVLVTRGEAIVFVDGRYVTQLAEQVDGSVFSGGDLVGEPPHLWIPKHAAKGLRLGIDPWLHTGGEVRKLEKALEKVGGALVLLDHNPLDRLWTDRPSEPLGRVRIQPIEFAGKLATDKIAEMARKVTEAGADALAVTDPSTIAWLFNIRGSDVPHTPTRSRAPSCMRTAGPRSSSTSARRASRKRLISPSLPTSRRRRNLPAASPPFLRRASAS